MKTILWIVGEPGVGKTTLVRKLLGDGTVTIAKPKWTLGSNQVVAAGHYIGEVFDGADSVPYNGVQDALEFWLLKTGARVPLTIFDGDRFSHDKVVAFFAQLSDLRLCCILLSGGPEVAARRAARSEQDATWVKGRITKARNFWETFRDRIEIRGSENEMFQQTQDFLTGARRNEPMHSSSEQGSLFGAP